MCLGLSGPGIVVGTPHWVPVVARYLCQAAVGLLWRVPVKTVRMSTFLSMETCLGNLGVALLAQHVF